jgi:hypothetical protein
MTVRTLRRIFILILSLAGLNSCRENEFNPNLIADPTPVVYGIIHPQDSIYSVRLTKTFNGAGSAYDMARIKDSLYFQGARVYFETRTSNGKLVERVELVETVIEDRLPGIFAETPNVIYQTDASRLHIRPEYFLSQGKDYNLSLNLIAEIPGASVPVTAATQLRTLPRITKPQFSFMKVYFYSEEPFGMEWMDTNDDSDFEILVRLKYRDFLYDEQRDQVASWVLTGVDVNGTSFPGGERTVYSYYFRPENFYAKLAASIGDDPEVEARVAQNLDFIILSTNREMQFYRDIYEISDDYHGSGYSNIQNGLGLFTTYSSAGIYNLLLGQTELDSLAKGRYTKHLRFKNW